MTLTEIDTSAKSEEVYLKNLTYLSFRGNPLESLEKSIFYPLRNSSVKMLNLQNCQLESINKDAFRHLYQIEQIDFFNNPGLSHNRSIDDGSSIHDVISFWTIFCLPSPSSHCFVVLSSQNHRPLPPKHTKVKKFKMMKKGSQKQIEGYEPLKMTLLCKYKKVF